MRGRSRGAAADHRVRLGALFAAVVGGMLLLIAAPSLVRAADTLLPFTSTVATADDQLGTTSNDLSGVTWNSDTNRILMVDNLTNRIHEYDLDATGALVIGPRRTIDITVGGGDYEGITWISDTSYAVLSENTGTIEFVTIPDAITFTSIGAGDVTSTVDTFIPEAAGGLGVEGIAIDRSASNGVDVFWVVREKDPALFRFDSLGNQTAIIALPDVLDASGVWVSPTDDTIWVVSDESQIVVQYEVDAAAGTATLISSQDLPAFEQAEGIVVVGDQMHIVGESPTDGLTWALFGDPTLPTPTPTATATATPDPTATPTPTATATPTPDPTATPTPTATATPTPDPTATPTPTATATPDPTATATPTSEPTATPTSVPTATPTAAAPVTTAAPTTAPVADPGTFSNAPSAASGAFGFGANPQADGDSSDLGQGGGDADRAASTVTDGAGLAATGSESSTLTSIAVALVGLGGCVLIIGRRRG